MSKLSRSLLIGSSLAFLASCNTKYKVWVGPDQSQKIYNLSYGMHSRQKMDLFLPAEYPETTPTIVMVHGGAWKYGNKRSLIHVQKFLFKNGFPTVNINYRLVSKKKGITYKDQLNDIGLAIEKMNDLTGKAKLQKNNYIILGESAGAHLSLLYGYKNPDQIKKIISLSGPTDFFSPTFTNSFYSKYSLPTIEKVVGLKYNRKDIPNEFVEASPIANISNVPTLLFQGNRDFLVNKHQGFMLDSALTSQNIEHKLIVMDKSGHIPRQFSKTKRDSIIYPAILDWIKK